MSTPEGKVKEQVKRVLKKHGAYWHCVVQNGMGAPSLDFVCCHRGNFVAIETKAGSKRPTPRQELTIKDMEQAGAKVFVVNEDTGTGELDAWLTSLED
jgi:hypothetical protein